VDIDQREGEGLVGRRAPRAEARHQRLAMQQIVVVAHGV
jgi:hypothetical protein